MFNNYSDSGLTSTLDAGAKVTIDGLWGWGDNGPGDMFKVLTDVGEGDTVHTVLCRLHVLYTEQCALRRVEPREAYGYEVIRRDADGNYVIYLGT